MSSEVTMSQCSGIPTTQTTAGLTHPLLNDIEDLSTELFSRGINTTPFDTTLIAYVKGLCLDANNQPLTYKSTQDYEKRINELRRTLKIQPKKRDLNQVYQILWSNGELNRNKTLERYLRLKSVRSESGVLSVTVLTSPGNFSCPKDCYFCPDERDADGKQVMPRSYLSSEPACKRAAENQFDAVLQFFSRVDDLRKNGHVPDKVDILALGGTWSFYPVEYQETFIRDLYYAANVFFVATGGLRPRLSLSDEQTINETAQCRIIGLTLETRPDYITLTEIKRFRRYGCTRVQLGIQHTDNEILRKVNRDHGVEHSIKAIKLLKENGFKIEIHVMLDLPGSSPAKDVAMCDEVFKGTKLRADYAKIYPFTVTPFTKLKEDYDSGVYVPYAELDNGRHLIDVIKHIKRTMTEEVRLSRIYRDFPNQDDKKGIVGAVGGIMLTNLRQIVMQELEKENQVCACIRCREVGIGVFDWANVALFVRTYRASEGIEYFISIESRDAKSNNDKNHTIFGFARLRFNDPNFEKRIFDKKYPSLALIRELHVYGSIVKVDTDSPDATQHLGIGKRLLQEAERIAADAGYTDITIISGVGVRNYYRKRGYEMGEYGYMFKSLVVPIPSQITPAEMTNFISSRRKWAKHSFTANRFVLWDSVVTKFSNLFIK